MLLWTALFLCSLVLQYANFAVAPASVLAATGLKAATVQGFEVDGDLDSGNAASNPGAIPPALQGSLVNGDDWLDGASGNGVVDPATPPSSFIVLDAIDSTSDDGFIGGAKETDTRTWGYTAHKATPKDDVRHAMTYAKFVGSSAFFYAGATRIVNNGDTHIDFELNRKPFKVYSDGISKPERSVGDVLVSLEFSNGGSDPIVTVYKVTAVQNFPTGQLTTFSTDIATAAAVHSATNFVALADQGLGYAIPEFQFAETSIDLAALGINTGCPGLSNGHIRTRAGGDLDSSQLKDNIPPFPIDLNNCGTVIIEKDAVPNDAQDFSFSGDFGNFQLDDDGNGGLPKSVTFTEVAPSAYSVTEAAQTGWSLTGIACTDANSSGSTGTRTATINVEANETVKCTFTNERWGKIITVKQTDPDGSTQSFEFDPSWGANFNLTDGQSNDSGFLAPDTYSVAEVNIPDGWDLTGATCSDGSDPSAIGLALNEVVTCTFNDRLDGRIITVKQTDPDGSTQSFEFDPSWGANFSLTDGQQNDSGFLTPGSGYSVVELVPAGWDLSTVSCSDGSPNTNISLAAGETVTCTFNNRQDGKIIVEKQTVPDGSSQSFEFDPSWGANFSLTDGQQNDSGNLDPGTYSVAEIVPTGWELTGVTCSDGSDPSSIGLGAGEVVTCVFTNTQQGTIIVEKQTNPDGASQSFHFDASYDADGFDLTDGQQNNSGFLSEGTYSVSEDVPAGWDLTSAVCDDGSAAGAIDLDPGETVTCVFTNTQRGSITVVKQTDPDGDTQQFTFVPSWGASFQLSDGQSSNSGPLVPGDYSVSESVPAGWDLISATCDDGSDPADIGLAAGETVTCTFVNQKDANIVVVKQTLPDGSTQSFEFDPSWGANFSLTDGDSADSGDLDPGTYSVSETVPAGWDLDEATCDDGSDPSSIGLSAGETITCTFVNVQRGTIIVEKQTSPDGAAGDFTFSGDAAGTIGDGGQIVVDDLVPGTYTSTEANPAPDFDLGAIVCDDANSDGDVATRTATFELEPGETVTCVFWNVQRGTITIIKDAQPNDAQDFHYDVTGLDGPVAFDLDDDDDATLDNAITLEDLVPGDYSVTEAAVDGWDLTSLECNGTNGSTGTADGATADITLTDGGSVTCLYVNSLPSIEIVKTAGDAEDGEELVVEPGPVEYTYVVTNSGPVTLVDIVVTDDNGTPADTTDDFAADCPATTLAAGESMTCTFTVEITGNRTNVAVARGVSEKGTTVEDEDDAVVRVPGIDLDKGHDDTDGIVGHGQTVTYTLSVSVFEGPVTDAFVIDELPAGQTYVDGSETSTADEFLVVEDEGVVFLIWFWDSLASDTVITYQVTIDDDAPTGDQTNFAELCVAEIEECVPDDTTVTVPELVIEKSFTGNSEGNAPDGTPQAAEGDTLTYTLTYTLTNGPVHNGVITDTLPAGLAYIADSAEGNDEFDFDSFDAGSRTLTWTAPLVTKSGSVTYQVLVLEGAAELVQPLVNVATIDSDETDEDEDDAAVFVAPPPLEETATPKITLPPTDSLGRGGQDSGSGPGLMLVLLGLAGLVLVLGFVTPVPERVRRRGRRR